MRILHKRTLGLLALTALAGGVLVSGIAFAGSSTENGVTQSLDFEFKPGTAPKDDAKGGSITVGVEIETPQGRPPAAEHVNLDFDDDFTFDARKVKKCEKADVETLDSDAARQKCGKAQIGTGKSVVSCIINAQGATAELPGSVTAFNGAGGTKKKPEVLLHAYVPSPTGAITTVLVGTLINSPLKGDFGKRLSIPVELLGGGLCAIKEFEAKVKKVTKVKRKGETKRYDYIAATCGDKAKQWDMLGEFTYRQNSFGVNQLVPSADQRCKVG